MRRTVLGVFLACALAALAACGKPASANEAPSNRPPAEVTCAPDELVAVRDRACACTDQACAEGVQAELSAQRDRAKDLLEQADACVARYADDGEQILAKMREYKDQTCACKDQACIDHVEEDAMAWMMKNADKFKDVKPTKAQDQEADRIEDEMDACKKRITP